MKHGSPPPNLTAYHRNPAMELLVMFLVLFVGSLLIIWPYQFAQLMILSDENFPGSYDKILWVVAFILVFPLAPFAFMAWKSAVERLKYMNE